MKGFKVIINERDGVKREIDYGLRESMIEVIFNPALKLNSIKLLKQNELAKKILDSKDYLLLEEEEYVRLKEAFEKIEGLGKNDVILVERVINAEKVQVEAK